ncbi:MAG: penicillin-binding protein 1C [Anaerolineales bacterium]
MKRTRKIFFLSLLAGLLLLVAGLLTYVFAGLPDIASLSQHLRQPSLRITDRNGRLLYEVLPPGSGQHAVVSLDRLPVCMKQATLAAEDENFYQNSGVDLTGILRAFWINLQGGETLAGGSTITQQVARNLLLPDESNQRTLRRKLREALLAWQLARKYSKDDILALYLNQTYYGSFAYGVEAASQIYFGKPAADLSLTECALLAGLPQAPSLYNPFSNPGAALERQQVVLGLMKKDGFITPAEYQQAEQSPLSYNQSPFPINAPHFVWMVKDLVDSLIESGRLDRNASLVVRTTLDLNIQQIAETAIARQIARFKNDGGMDHHVNNAAVVVLDPRTGEILGLVGSADYFNDRIDGAVNMAISPRQPGSAFKPLIYAAAFDPQSASPWTAATPILDVQTVFTTHDGQSYIPQDYDTLEHGIVPARVALASSLNIPAVATLNKVGVSNMVSLAHRLGIASLGDPDEFDLSLALGGGQMTLLELTTAYATLANRGLYPGNYAILDIRDADGNLLYTQEKAQQAQIFDPRVAWLISDILGDDQARQIGFGLNSTLKLDRPVAVKTGTTSNFHDNWTVGYTPSLVVGVWVGNSDYQAMQAVNGLTGAAPIWQETLRAILQNRPVEDFVRPPDMLQVNVCTYSGLLPTALCDQTHLEWFIPGTQPTQPDTVYHQVWIDSATGLLADDSTPPAQRRPVIALDLPPTAQRWAHSQGIRLLSDLTALPEPAAPQLGGLVMISPEPDSAYRISGKLALSDQQLPIETAAGQGLTGISLWVDGRQLGDCASAPYLLWWQLSAGTHQFWAQGLSSDGQTVKSNVVQITVTQ